MSFTLRLMPALARLGRKHRGQNQRHWIPAVSTADGRCYVVSLPQKWHGWHRSDACAAYKRSRLTHRLCAGCGQPLGCQDREPQWVDLLYEPALGSFLEWHPVATFFGAYIKLLRQVGLGLG